MSKSIQFSGRRTIVPLMLIVMGLIICVGCGENTPTNAPPAAAIIQVGDEGYLDNTLDTVLVGRTQEANNRLTDAEIAKDTVGMQKIIDAGDAFFVVKGTKVKLIGFADGMMGALTYHVRFEGGAHADDDGWVACNWMKK